jgi:hypothetical protein
MEEDVHFEYLDDDGNEQGPFPVSSVVSWVQSGFFSGSRRVRKVGDAEFVALSTVAELAQYLPGIVAPTSSSSSSSNAVGDELVPQTEEERMLSEYYQRYYEQAFAKAAADYQEQLQRYNEALKQHEEEANKKRDLPDDGYVMPKPSLKTTAWPESFPSCTANS